MIPLHFDSLSEWLDAIEKLHPKQIEMGLGRISKVKEKLNLAFFCPIVLVGGTNGKGSTCTFLQSIWQAAGFRVGLYTSPHIHLFEERIQINGKTVKPKDIVQAFQEIEKVRGDVELTFFEYTTLAALSIFSKENLDALILEVGLGGRLDATNLMDADVAIVTNVDMDHENFLGLTKEAIGYEKAGIYRKDKFAIYGDILPPESLLKHASDIGAKLLILNRDYAASQVSEKNWSYRGKAMRLKNLPFPTLYGAHQIKNATNALMAIELLSHRLEVDEKAIIKGLQKAYVPGRFEVIQKEPLTILDVAHNPHAAKVLRENLLTCPTSKTYAVYGAMADKDIQGVLVLLKDIVDEWFITNLPLDRAEKVENLARILTKMGVKNDKIHSYQEAKKAFESAKEKAQKNDKIVAFGSFWIVTGITE